MKTKTSIRIGYSIAQYHSPALFGAAVLLGMTTIALASLFIYKPAHAARAADAPEATTKPTGNPTITKEKNMTNMTAYVTASEIEYSHHAKGSFDVKLTPQAAEANANIAAPGRMTIAKQFHGDLAAASEGQMLAAQTGVKGSAGYVAMERVTGTLHNRKGSFLLQHTGTMNRGTPTLSVTVVPDSGTDELTGLTGKMNIIIAEGKHSYEFDYSLATKP